VEPTDTAKHALARRLRELRLTEWPGLAVTQPQLAKALGVSVPSISAWESERSPQPPPANRLDDYARFFATQRSLAGGKTRLLDEDDLTPDEQVRRDELGDELAGLREAIDAPVSRWPVGGGRPHVPTGPLVFTDGAPITIVCAPLPDYFQDRMPYGDPDEPDYVESYSYADLDGLIELHGHVRAMNPDSQVRIRRASDMSPDDLTTHLLLLGGVDWNELTRDLLDAVSVPVSQMARENDPVGAFEVGEGDDTIEFRPHLERYGDKQRLVSDVAHLFRGPSPLNWKRTVTIFNGMFGRGTYGAVRILTDARFRDRNADYLRGRFHGDTYSVLARVQIVMREVVTPDLTVRETRLHEWPEA
jgi:transcriptional regulator with XRE-family HTH domain